MTPTLYRPTVARIDLGRLAANLGAIRRALAGRARVLAVVKADAYGHGAGLVGPVLEAAGADAFGVATVEEGCQLRAAGVQRPILVLAGAGGGDVDAVVEHGLSVAVVHAAMARDLAAALGGRRLAVHVKIDTGMGRLGIAPQDLPELLAELDRAGCFVLEGLFSHFGNSDRVDLPYSDAQLQRMQAAVAAAAAGGWRPRWVHLSNSAGTLTRPDAAFSMVRPGIALYGMAPAGAAHPTPLRAVLQLRSRIVQLKDVPAGTAVSYGQTFVTARPSRIAVVPIGYADGYDRRLSNRGAMLVRGRRAPIAGTICMDLTMLDVTDVPGVTLGDEVVIIGEQAGAQLGVADVAAWQDSISYEVLTRLGKRIPRKAR